MLSHPLAPSRRDLLWQTGGGLGGYGFGLERKRWLLAHEAPAFALLSP